MKSYFYLKNKEYLDTMNKNWLIISLLILIVLSSGCIKNQPDGKIVYNDEALKMEIKFPEKTLPNQVANMKVTLTNQVEDDVKNINLRITDFYGLTLKNQTCSDGQPLPNCGFISDKCGWYFDKIQSLDDREINFVFRVPDEDELARIGRDLKPEITLSYDYSGETVFYVPILSASERSTNAKIQTSQTKGPIHVEIERGLTQSSDQWEMEDVAFPIIVWVKDKIKSDSERTISKDRFNITLRNLKIAEEAGVGVGRCDFEPVPADKTVLRPKDPIELPMKVPLICTLVGDVPEGVPWITSMAIVDYDYTYTVIKTETITVETVIT
jgi:hypothetical protein